MFHVKDKKSFLLYIGFILLVVILINVISRNIHFRLDFTENNIYSLSESSELIVDKMVMIF